MQLSISKPHKIYAEVVDSKAIDQFKQAMAQDFVVQGALMPDVHAGYSLPIGAVVATDGVIVPAYVGFDIGCTDGETEYLSPKGWVPMKDYQDGQVLQYDPDSDVASFVDPSRYIKKPSKGFFHLKQTDGLDQMLSADHKMLFYHGAKARGYKYKTYTPVEFLAKHQTLRKGVQGGFKTTFKVDQPDIPMSDDLIRLYVMVSADGCLRTNNRIELHFSNRFELHFSKEHKIQRAKLLLEAAEVPFTLTVVEDGTTFIYFRSDLIADKDLSIFWKASNRQLNIVAEECTHWDGYNGSHTMYSTKHKYNADVIQFAFANSNTRCGIATNSYPDKVWNDSHTVYATKNEYVGFPKSSTSEFTPSPDGLEYCFTVPSGFFVARRNGKIFITGNCGMCAIKTTFSKHEVSLNAKKIFDSIYKSVPVGFSHNAKPQQWARAESLLKDCSRATQEIFSSNGLNQLGTLGGGNHFAEIGYDEQDQVWIVIHSGSRGIGHAIASHHMRIASGSSSAKDGHFGLGVHSDSGREYISDLEFGLQFALENRRQMISKIVDVLASCTEGDADWAGLINRNHNHAELRDGLWIHRKGATHADAGMMGVIPGNMRDGSFIVKGLGNPDSLYSSSHGAGRVFGRKKAKETLALGDFEVTMEGITARITEATLDESPFAYKDIFEVMRLQQDLVEVVCHIRPMINVKG